MYSGLLIILAPLIIGYLIPVSNQPLKKLINRGLSAMVYVILFLMGISLALVENLGSNLLVIVQYTAVFTVFVLGCNLAGLFLYGKQYPWQVPAHKQQKPPSRLHMVLESLQLCCVLLVGFAVGLFGWSFLSFAGQASEYALIFLLFLVGIQLRNSGMTLKQILINRRGMLVSLIVAATSLAGGALAALLIGLPLKTGMALASGFGWYSLSGILLTDAFGPVLGSVGFFNDLAREIAAIMLIPLLINRHRAAALGLGGATTMDFTLPVLQRSGGVSIVPAAIVHGFVLSLFAPVLIALFT